MKFRMNPAAKFALAALVAALAALIAFSGGEGSWRSNFAGDKVFPQLDPDAVAAIEISSAGRQVSLLKDSGVWTIKQRDGHKASMPKVAKTLSAVASMKSARRLDDISARELKELGIEPGSPSGPLIRLFDAKGAKLAELGLGRGYFRNGQGPSPQERPDGRYCMASGASGQGTPLLSNSLFEWLELEPGKWLEPPSFDFTKALSLSASSSKSGSWSVARGSLKEPFVFAPPLKGAPSPKTISSVLSALSGPPVSDLASAEPGDLNLYDTLLLSVGLEGGSSIELVFGLGQGRAILRVSGSGQPSKWTYESDPRFAKALLSPPPAEQPQP